MKKYKQVYYKNLETGEVRMIGANGWDAIKGRTYKKGRKRVPNFEKLDGKPEGFGEKAPKLKKTAPETNANEQVVVDAVQKGILKRDGTNLIFEQEGQETQTFNHIEIVKNADAIKTISDAIKNCKNC